LRTSFGDREHSFFFGSLVTDIVEGYQHRAEETEIAIQTKVVQRIEHEKMSRSLRTNPLFMAQVRM
jgi:hypothetical protein